MSDEVLGYRIVAVKACPFCVDGDVAAADEPEPIFCFKCDGTGSRLVDTGITVERTTVETNMRWTTDRWGREGPDFDYVEVWREVPDA